MYGFKYYVVTRSYSSHCSYALLIQLSSHWNTLWSQHVHIPQFPKQSPPSNSSRTIGSSKRNKHRPQIVAASSTRGVQTRVPTIPADAHQATSPIH